MFSFLGVCYYFLTFKLLLLCAGGAGPCAAMAAAAQQVVAQATGELAAMRSTLHVLSASVAAMPISSPTSQGGPLINDMFAHRGKTCVSRNVCRIIVLFSSACSYLREPRLSLPSSRQNHMVLAELWLSHGLWYHFSLQMKRVHYYCHYYYHCYYYYF